jgi:hypothetical protein
VALSAIFDTIFEEVSAGFVLYQYFDRSLAVGWIFLRKAEDMNDHERGCPWGTGCEPTMVDETEYWRVIIDVGQCVFDRGVSWQLFALGHSFTSVG